MSAPLGPHPYAFALLATLTLIPSPLCLRPYVLRPDAITLMPSPLCLHAYVSPLCPRPYYVLALMSSPLCSRPDALVLHDVMTNAKMGRAKCRVRARV